MSITPTLPKPRHGQPCNMCGRCCRAVLCPLAQHVFGFTDGPCPALGQLDGTGKLVCVLMLFPSIFAPQVARKHGPKAATVAAQTLIGWNIGCDAAVEGEPIDMAFSKRVRESVDTGRVGWALQVWGVE